MTTTTAEYRPPERSGAAPRLDAALGRRGVTEGLLDGSVRSPRWHLEPHEVSPLPRAFRMMVNERTFHVAEMALTTLAMAIEAGRAMIGLPVVLNRDFHYRSIVVRAGSGITDPAQLRGRRIGVRAYSQTTGVWVRGLLHDRFGLDPAHVTWVALEGAHVAEYVDPPHVERAPEGRTLVSLLASGDIEAAVIMDPDTDPQVAVPLFPDAMSRASADHSEDGVYPVNHVVALDTGLVAEHPGIAEDLFAAFTESKQRYLRRLHTDGPRTRADRHALAMAGIVGSDFNPYGLEPNRGACERLLTYAHRQGLITTLPPVDSLFHPVAAGGPSS